MKRLIFCFDGSWNKLDTPHPTNVLFTAETVLPLAKNGISQLIFYDEGVGTTKGEKYRGGALGYGVTKNLSDGLRFLTFNYTPGDEIYIFGFSRGAFTARSFAGLLSTCGVLSRHKATMADKVIKFYQSRNGSAEFKEQAFKFRAEYSVDVCVSKEDDAWRVKNLQGYSAGQNQRLTIRYLGVWDTVGALGIPKRIFGASAVNKSLQFHDVSLSNTVESARHAVSIDEGKPTFEPTLWDNLSELNGEVSRAANPSEAKYQQVWFPGVHGGVGGGGKRRGLSDQALEWVWDGARQMGLRLDTSGNSRVWELAPNPRDYLENTVALPPKSIKDWSMFAFNWVMQKLPKKSRWPGPSKMYEVDISAQRRWKETPEFLAEKKAYRPATLGEQLAKELDNLDADILGVGPERDIGEFEYYTIQPRETLKTIAQEYYGDATLDAAIFEANRNLIYNPVKIYAWMKIRLPKYPKNLIK